MNMRATSAVIVGSVLSELAFNVLSVDGTILEM